MNFDWGSYQKWVKLQKDMNEFDKIHKIGKYKNKGE